MKIATVKNLVAKGILLTLAAGAVITASPARAEAPRFAVGVQVGRPYYAPRYDRFEFERRQEFLRRQEMLRHEEWLRAHRFERSYGYR